MHNKISTYCPSSNVSLNDVKHMRFLIIHAQWNPEIVTALKEGVISTLVDRYGIQRANIDVVTVPGSYELPFATKSILKYDTNQSADQPTRRSYDAVIPIGVLIKGSTMHFEYISQAVTQGLMTVSLEMDTPVVFGVLTCLTEEQAKLRAGFDEGIERGHNHGIAWAVSAVEMALLHQGKFKYE